MKRNWERLRPHADLDRATITEMVDRAFPGREVVACDLRTTGLANSNYRVLLAGPGADPEPVLLRVYVRDPGALEKEAEIARRFAGALPMAEVLYTGDFESTGRATARYAVFRWVEGELADVVVEREPAAMAEVASACGGVLAAIQAVRFPAPGFFDSDLTVMRGVLGSRDYVDWMRTYLFRHGAAGVLGDPVAERVWQLAAEGAPLLAEVQADASLVHCDFNGANILVRREEGTWKVAGVLDWEFACAGSTMIDVGNMLRHYAEEGEEFERPFIAGFEGAGGQLPRHWRQTADLYDLMSLCGFLVDPEAGDRIKEDVTGLVQAALGRWGY